MQNGLFAAAPPEAEKLELTLAKIRGLVGATNVIVPKMLDSYRPGWSVPEDAAGRSGISRPALEARVEVEVGGPETFMDESVSGGNPAGGGALADEWELVGCEAVESG